MTMGRRLSAGASAQGSGETGLSLQAGHRSVYFAVLAFRPSRFIVLTRQVRENWRTAR